MNIPEQNQAIPDLKKERASIVGTVKKKKNVKMFLGIGISSLILVVIMVVFGIKKFASTPEPNANQVPTNANNETLNLESIRKGIISKRLETVNENLALFRTHISSAESIQPAALSILIIISKSLHVDSEQTRPELEKLRMSVEILRQAIPKMAPDQLSSLITTPITEKLFTVLSHRDHLAKGNTAMIFCELTINPHDTEIIDNSLSTVPLHLMDELSKTSPRPGELVPTSKKTKFLKSCLDILLDSLGFLPLNAEFVDAFLDLFKKLLQDKNSEINYFAIDALKTVHSLVNTSKLISKGFVSIVIDLLSVQDASVQKNCLLFLEEMIDRMNRIEIESQAYPELLERLTSLLADPELQENCCNLVVYIAGSGSSEQLELLYNSELIPTIISTFKTRGNLVRPIVPRVIKYLATHDNILSTCFLDKGYFMSVFELLASQDMFVVEKVLNILKGVFVINKVKRRDEFMKSKMMYTLLSLRDKGETKYIRKLSTELIDMLN